MKGAKLTIHDVEIFLCVVLQNRYSTVKHCPRSIKSLCGMLCCSNLPFHCSHSTQATTSYKCVYYTGVSYKSSEIAVSFNLKTWVPSLPACFWIQPVNASIQDSFHWNVAPCKGGNLLKFFLSPSFCKLSTGVYFARCCYLVTFWMVEKHLDQNGLVYSHFKTNPSQNQSVAVWESV